MTPFTLEYYKANASYSSFRFQNDIAYITKHYLLSEGVLPSMSDCQAHCAEITERSRRANTDLSCLGSMFYATGQPNCMIFLEVTSTPTQNSSDNETASLEDEAKSTEDRMSHLADGTSAQPQQSSNNEAASLRNEAKAVNAKLTRLANGRPWPSASTPLLTDHNFNFLTLAFLSSLLPAFLTKNLFAHLHFHIIPALTKTPAPPNPQEPRHRAPLCVGVYVTAFFAAASIFPASGSLVFRWRDVFIAWVVASVFRVVGLVLGALGKQWLEWERRDWRAQMAKWDEESIARLEGEKKKKVRDAEKGLEEGDQDRDVDEDEEAVLIEIEEAEN